MVLDEAETDDLLRPAAAGDEVALRLLFDRYRERLRRMIALRLDRRLAARLDPSDVVQEALLDAGVKLRRYAEERPIPFYPWLRRLAAERLALAHRRHLDVAGRSVRCEQPAPPAGSDASHDRLVERFVTSDTSPSGRLRREEARRRVTLALASLAEIDREILVLRYLEDLPFAEIAFVLQVTENAAKVRHFRAIDRMRKLLEEGSTA